MNLNNDIAVVRAREAGERRPLRLGPLHQLHPGRSRSLVRHHDRLHRSTPRVEFSCWHHISIKPQFPDGIVSSVSFVSTTNTARSLAGFVLLALALTPWRSTGSSEKLCPAS